MCYFQVGSSGLLWILRLDGLAEFLEFDLLNTMRGYPH